MVKVNQTTSLDLKLKTQVDRIPDLSFSDCLEFGIRFKLAELDLEEYPYNKLSKKIEKIQRMLTEAYEEIEKLKASHNEDSEKSGVEE